MKKMIIALFLVFAMLISLTPAVAADDTSARPTVEEILSQYHQAAFEAEMSGEVATASTYSRSGSSDQTLEQQTVETLNEAGYEAYNVTADNYNNLEEQLQTDFSEMGLDPEGSYIVVIHGEEEQTNNGNARLGDLILPPHLREDGYGTTPETFTHMYNNVSYTMRYITVTAASESELFRSFSYTLSSDEFPETWEEILYATLAYTADEVFKVPIASIMSLLVDINTDSSFELLDNEDIKILGNTTWTLQYIQIYNADQEVWVSAQSSEKAESRAYCSGYLYNSETNKAERYVGNESVFTTSSEDYNNTTKRKNQAVSAYLNGNGTAVIRDITGDIDFYLIKETNGFNYCGSGNPLFTQPHWNI